MSFTKFSLKKFEIGAGSHYDEHEVWYTLP